VQFDLYRKVNAVMAKTVASPSLVIYLKSSPAGCLKRIKERKRPYESDIDLAFLENLHNSYQRFFETFNLCPVITVDTEAADFRQREQVESLGKKINYYINNK